MSYKGEVFKFECVEEISQFEALQNSWRTLYYNIGKPTISLAFDWCYLWWKKLSLPTDILKIIVARSESGELIGIVPLYLQAKQWPLPRILRIIGSADDARSVCPEYADALVDVSIRRIFCEQLSRYLQTMAWDRFDFDPLSTDRSLSPAGIARIEHVPGYKVNFCDGGFDAFIQAQAADRRKRHRTMLRDADRAQLGFSVAKTLGEATSFLAQLIDLHAERWKQCNERGAFSLPALVEFHNELIKQLWEDEGKNQSTENIYPLISKLSDGDRPIAFVYGFGLGKRFEAYQAAALRDSDSPVRSPGMVAHLLTLKYLANESEVRSYDLLGGFSEYKRRLATEEYSLEKGVVVADTIFSRGRDFASRIAGRFVSCSN